MSETPTLPPQENIKSESISDFDRQNQEAIEVANAHGGRPEPQSDTTVFGAEAGRRLSRGQVAGGVIGGAVLVGMAAGGIAGLTSMEGGNTNGAERGELNPSIESITLTEGANVRFDPYVGEGEDNNNVLHLDAPVQIDANHDIRVLEGTSNGTWYGIPVADFEAKAPNFDDKNDKDGILWVNEQGVETVAVSNNTDTQLETK